MKLPIGTRVRGLQRSISDFLVFNVMCVFGKKNVPCTLKFMATEFQSSLKAKKSFGGSANGENVAEKNFHWSGGTPYSSQLKKAIPSMTGLFFFLSKLA